MIVFLLCVIVGLLIFGVGGMRDISLWLVIGAVGLLLVSALALALHGWFIPTVSSAIILFVLWHVWNDHSPRSVAAKQPDKPEAVIVKPE